MKFIINHFFLCLTLLVATVIYFLTGTTTGLELDIKIAQHFLPGKLQIEKVDGKLASTFSLRDMSYQSATQDIKVQHFAVTWHPAALLVNKVALEAVTLEQAMIVIKPSQTSSKWDWQNFKWLNYFNLQKLTLHNVQIRTADAQLFFTGELAENFALRWKINVAQTLQSTGYISGPRLSPTIEAKLFAQQLTFPTAKVQRLSLAAKIILQPGVNSTLQCSAVGLTIHDFTLPKLDLSVSGNMQRKNSMLLANLDTKINDNYRILAQINLPKFAGFTLNQPVNATLQSSLTQLDFLAQWLKDLKNLQGNLHVALNITGTLAKPNVVGKFNLTQGKFSIPVLGISPQQINLQANGDLTKQLTISGNFHSGKGMATLQGTLDLTQKNYPLLLHAQGEELQTIHLAEYNIVTSPVITLQFADNNLQISGDIFIPSATIAPKNFTSTVTLPSEVVFVGKKTLKNSLPFTTQLQLTIQLGKKIHLAYHDLEADLGGKIQISQSPVSATTANGMLYTMNGTYTAYGQTLKIDTGRLVFTGGSLMNPGLDILATKQIRAINMANATNSFTNQTTLQPVYTGVENITVGVRVQGTLNQPVFALYSNPAFNQSDILSYLVFGYPQSQSSGQQGALLSALAALNPNAPGATQIVKTLQDKLGFSELSVQSTEIFNPATNSAQSTTAFVVGKQFGDRFSIHYSVGLFYPISIINLRYQLSKHWAVQSETSSIDNGADVLYSIERE